MILRLGGRKDMKGDGDGGNGDGEGDLRKRVRLIKGVR
jgi:hypothetical protein